MAKQTLPEPGFVPAAWIEQCRADESPGSTLEHWITVATNTLGAEICKDRTIKAIGRWSSRKMTQTEIDNVIAIVDRMRRS